MNVSLHVWDVSLAFHEVFMNTVYSVTDVCVVYCLCWRTVVGSCGLVQNYVPLDIQIVLIARV